MIRCVVFDFDGTLVDSNRIKRRGFLDVADGYPNGPTLMKGILERDDAGDRFWIFDRFAEALSMEISSEELAGRYTRSCEEQISVAPEIPGTTAALRELRLAGRGLYVNSATPVEPLRKLIDLRGMASWFDGVFGAPKGKVENLETIMAGRGCARSETVMVGDGESDRVAAEQVGCRFIGIRNDLNNFSKSPVELIDDLWDLPRMVSNE